MRLLFVFSLLTFFSCEASSSGLATPDAFSMDVTQNINPYVQLSINLLEGMKNNTDVSEVLNQLAAIDLDILVESLNTKQKKLAFWVNIYNGFIQYDLVRDAKLFDNKDNFYKGQRHKIAGINMSFDNIEHGILRNSRVKLSLGYVKRIFVKNWEKRLRNKDIDGRIHFALNCGAKDCPPIGIFNDVEVEKQLDQITKQYLLEHTKVEALDVTTSPLFSWFRGDFGGKKGIQRFLKRYEVIPQGKYKLNFKSYDWTLDIGNYIAL